MRSAQAYTKLLKCNWQYHICIMFLYFIIYMCLHVPSTSPIPTLILLFSYKVIFHVLWEVYFCYNNRTLAQHKNTSPIFCYRLGIWQLAGFTGCQRKEIEAMCQVSPPETVLLLGGRLAQKHRISSIMCNHKPRQCTMFKNNLLGQAVV